MSNKEIRISFQRWAQSQGYSITLIGTLEDPSYASHTTRIAWEAWLARSEAEDDRTDYLGVQLALESALQTRGDRIQSRTVERAAWSAVQALKIAHEKHGLPSPQKEDGE